MVCKSTPRTQNKVMKILNTSLNDNILSHRDTLSISKVKPIWRHNKFNKCCYSRYGCLKS